MLKGRFFVYSCDAQTSIKCQGDRQASGYGLPPGFQYKHPANQPVQHACPECLAAMTEEQRSNYRKPKNV